MTPYYLAFRAIGWKVVGEFPDIKKSIVIMAPHTSKWDAVIGKLALLSLGVRAKLFAWHEYFFFPLSIGMKILGAHPVGGKGHNAIFDAINFINANENLHVVICPEGQLKETEKWNPGFMLMAQKTNVPVVVTYLDYKKKEAGFKTVLTDFSDKDAVIKILAECYDGVTARHPEKFLLPKYAAKADE